MFMWKKIQTVFYRPEFFAHRQFLTEKKSLRFYAVLILAFLGFQILFSMPGIARFFHEVLSEEWQRQTNIVQRIFPEQLTVTVSDGVLSTNQSRPTVISIPIEWRSTAADMPENLIVLDTAKAIETADFARHDTLIILGKDSFGIHNPQKNEFRIINTRDHDWNESFTITKEGYDAFIAKTSRALRTFLIVITILLPLFLYVLFFVGILIYLLFGAGVVWIAAKVRNWPLSYTEAYVAAIYLLPIPLAYNLLFDILPGNQHPLPFTFSILLFLVALLHFPKMEHVLPVASEVAQSKTTEDSVEVK